MDDVGLYKGLAQDFSYDQRIGDLRYHSQQMERAKAINEAKAKMYSDDLEFMNAANSYDNPRIKEYIKKQVGIIGKFASDNPGWEGNVQQRTQMNLLKRELKDNPELQRGMASDDAFKQLNADLAEVAKNPEQHDSGAYDALMAQKDNYLKYGHQDGEDAARVHGAQAFVYRKPKNFIDLNKEFASVGNDFKDMKRESGKGGRNSYQEYANPETLKLISNQMYSQNKVQIDREATKLGIDPVVYTMKGIDAHIKKVHDYGDYGLSDAMTMRSLALKDKANKEDGKPAGPTTWDKEIKGKPMGMENGETMMKVIGPPPSVTLKDNQGKVIDLSDIDFKYSGNHKDVTVKVMDNNGKMVDKKQKMFEVYTMVPSDVSDKIGVTKNSWVGDNEISDNFAKNDAVSIVPRENKEGKVDRFTKIKSWVPVDVNNEGFRQRYDAENLPSKLRQGIEQEQPIQQRQVYSVADLRKDSRWTEADIQRAVKEGLAK